MARVQANETLFEFFYQNASNPLHMVQSSCFGRFRTIWLPRVHCCKIGSWDAVWTRVCADETIVEFYSQNTSNPLLQVQNSHFGWFCTIWLLQVHRCEIGSKTRARNTRTVSCFLATNMPNPLLQVQNSCFRRFCAILSTHPTCCRNQYRRAFD